MVNRMTPERSQIVIVDEDSDHLMRVVDALQPLYDAMGIETGDLLFEPGAFYDINLLLVSTGLIDTHFATLVVNVHKQWPGMPVLLIYHDDASYVRMWEHYGKLAIAAIGKPVAVDKLRELVTATLLTKPFSTLRKSNRNLSAS